MIIRDYAYFQNIRDRNMLILGIDIDNEFNNIINNINDVIIPKITNFINKEIVGVEGSADYFLQNIGNGGTRWAKLKTAELQLNNLKFDLFKNINYGILASNIDEEIESITPYAENLVFSSTANNKPIFNRITTEHFAAKTITGDKILLNKISTRHLHPNVLGSFNLGNNSIETRHLKDNSIFPGYRFGQHNYAITTNKLEQGLRDTRDNLIRGLIATTKQLKFDTNSSVRPESFVDKAIEAKHFKGSNTWNLFKSMHNGWPSLGGEQKFITGDKIRINAWGGVTRQPTYDYVLLDITSIRKTKFSVSPENLGNYIISLNVFMQWFHDFQNRNWVEKSKLHKSYFSPVFLQSIGLS